MRQIFVLMLLAFGLPGFAQLTDYPFQPVDFTDVKLTDNFWLPRLKINHEVTIPTSFARCENTGRVNNFVMAAEHQGKFCTLYPFDDTDIYKTIEGASFSLSLFPDSKLEAYVDSLIAIIGKALEPDGYLYTARTIDPLHVGPWVGKERWEKERELSHELYNAGHLYEAAAAHFKSTGKRNLLNIALKNADLVCSVFGPGKKSVAPGHEVVEMGLVKLYRITGKQEYLNTAKFFVYARGKYQGYDSTSNDQWKNGKYWQDDKPVVAQTEAEGHAVRAGYLYSAMADVAALTGDEQLLNAVDTIWKNMVSKKIYVQGGAGAVGSGERYGENYELPNNTAYNETCAAIANVYWNQRMFMLHGESKYIDVLEKILYNGLISGVGLDGNSFFYTNAMQVKPGFKHADLEVSRSGWFPCSCCPTNVTRLLPSVPGYVYALQSDKLFVNLFVNSESRIKVAGSDVTIVQKNNYPWDGSLEFDIYAKKKTSFPICIRIPGWSGNEAIPSDLYSFETAKAGHPTLKVNGMEQAMVMEKGYAVINRNWGKNDRIELELPMEVRRVVAKDTVKEDEGKIALQRGPIIYCAEGVDNANHVFNYIIPRDVNFTTHFQPKMLHGIVTLESQVPLLQVSGDQKSVATTEGKFVAIPYYAWAHRGGNEMRIWFPEKITDVDIISSR